MGAMSRADPDGQLVGPKAGHPPLDALSVAKRQRPRVSPSPEQLETFMAWAEERRVKRSLPWRTPTFDELADLAYCHPRPSPSMG